MRSNSEWRLFVYVYVFNCRGFAMAIYMSIDGECTLFKILDRAKINAGNLSNAAYMYILILYDSYNLILFFKSSSKIIRKIFIHSHNPWISWKCTHLKYNINILIAYVFSKYYLSMTFDKANKLCIMHISVAISWF